MKKFISSTLLSAVLLTTTVSPAYSAEKLATKMTVDQVFNEFKTSVFIKGEKMDDATNKLVSKIIDSKMTSGELQLWVAKNTSAESYKKFNEVLDTTLEDVDSLSDLGQEDMSFILKNAFEKTSATGSNFMSCAAGKTVGLPLLAVGVVLGIIALANASASKEVVTQEYIDKRRKQNTDYLNTVADLETEVTTYESDIIYYQGEVEEYTRRINSGEYSPEEVEQFYLIIRDNEFFISDSHALIGEVQVDLTFFENQYASDVQSIEVEEVSALNRVDERKASASKFGVAGGIIGGLGAVFTVAGLADCN